MAYGVVIMARPSRRKGAISRPQCRIRACTSPIVVDSGSTTYLGDVFLRAPGLSVPLQHLKVPVGFNEPIAKKGLGKLLAFRGGASSCGLVSGRRDGIGQRNSGFSPTSQTLMEKLI